MYVIEGNKGAFAVFSDYNHSRIVQVADALDADPKLDCYEYTGNKKLGINTARVRVSDAKLRNESREAQIAYIDAICKPIFEE